MLLPRLTAVGACSICGEYNAFDMRALGVWLCPEHAYEALYPAFREVGVELRLEESSEFYGMALFFEVPAIVTYKGEKYDFGYVDFELNPDSVNSGSVDPYTESDDHPHSNGRRLCVGDYHRPLVEAFRRMDVATLVALATVAAGTYSPGHEYHGIEIEECAFCGAIGDLNTCSCGHAVCDDCYDSKHNRCLVCGTRCMVCSSIVDKDNIQECEDCGDEVCEDCIEEYECAPAVYDTDGSTLIGAEIRWLCPYCRRKRATKPAGQLVFELAGMAV